VVARARRDRGWVSSAARPSSTAVCLPPGDLRGETARTLHDGVAQDLFIARTALFELAMHLDAGSPDRHLADVALDEVGLALIRTRELIDGLRTAANAPGPDLGPAVTRELIEFAMPTGIAVSYSETGGSGNLPPQAVEQVLGIVREALANVRKHADASEVRVRVRSHFGWTRLTVADNGCGFRPGRNADQAPGMGYGMGTMQERARAIGGRIGLRSTAGTGTTVTIDIPPPGASCDAA
jgi:two-component system, NarL family, nitrate/nitrite sensor histidine kinase NarX